MNKIVIILYGFVLTCFSVYSYFFIDQNLSYLRSFYSGFATGERGIVSVLFVLFVTLFYLFFSYLVYTHKKHGVSMKSVMYLSVFSAIVLLFSYPVIVSYDIFNYIATAKVLFTYGENPYIIMPIAFIGDPILSFMHAANKVALYGPVWILLTAVPYLFSAKLFLLSVYLFKLFVVIFFFGIVYLIWKMTSSVLSVLLFSLNPLVLFETAAAGHNDVVMMFFALFAVYLYKIDRKTIAVIVLFISILAKFATGALIPVFVYLFWKEYKKEKIHWQNVYLYCAIAMTAIFLLSPLREEIYPWYAIWFLTFITLMPQRKFLIYLSLIISFSLFFRYIPFMYLGTHFGITPIVKSSLTFFLPVLFTAFYVLKRANFKKH